MKQKYKAGDSVARTCYGMVRIKSYLEGREVYQVQRVARSVPEKDLLRDFPELKLEVGALIRYPNGKEFELIELGVGRPPKWAMVQSEVLELTEAQLENADAEVNADRVYASVATRRETGFVRRGARIRSRTEPRD